MIALWGLVGLCVAIQTASPAVINDYEQKQIMDSMVPMKATAYYGGIITRSGSVPAEGICASTLERLGKTAIVYKRNEDGSIGEYLGVYECKDTGGKGVKKGTVLDVYRDTYERCVDFMILVGDMNIYVQFVDAEG